MADSYAVRSRPPPYVMSPWLGLMAHWRLKLALAVVGSFLWKFIDGAVALYGELLTVDYTLVAMVLGVMALDWVTGIYRSVREGQPIQSRKFRQAGWKFLEYVVIGAAAVLLASGADRTAFGPAMGILDEATLLYIAATEFFSVLENVTGSRREAIGILSRIRAVYQGDFELDDTPDDKN